MHAGGRCIVLGLGPAGTQGLLRGLQPTPLPFPACPAAARLADQIIRFLNLVREHNRQRLRKQRRAARKAEAAAVEGAMAAMLDSLSAADVFEAAQVGGGSAEQEADEAAQGSQAEGRRSGGSGGRPRRHVTLQYEPSPRPAAAPAAPSHKKGGGKGRATAVGTSAGGDEGEGGWEGEEVEPSDAELLSLEWLRDAPDDVARNYLINIDGECCVCVCVEVEAANDAGK